MINFAFHLISLRLIKNLLTFQVIPGLPVKWLRSNPKNRLLIFAEINVTL
ncbi:MAG: hypothetical protein OEZ20_10010 [candidate division WOR-3 bacterium]|nr:hypothetical protein [candidate division WOR-3 bacterium]